MDSSKRMKSLIVPAVVTGLTIIAVLYASSDHPISASAIWDNPAFQDNHAWDHLAQARQDAKMMRPSRNALVSQGQKASIRTNLYPDKKYMMTWNGGGWNNEVINMINLLHGALLSKRIPILSPFEPHGGHLLGQAYKVAVGDIFDLQRFSATLNDWPVVELHELKEVPNLPPRLVGIRADGYTAQGFQEDLVGEVLEPELSQKDMIGCWSPSESRGQKANPWGGTFGPTLGATFTPFPWEIFGGREPAGHQASLVDLGRFLSQDHGGRIPPTSAEILKNNSWETPEYPPDDHIACVDSMFFWVEQATRYDMNGEYTAGEGPWNVIGQHLRFQPGLVDLAHNALRTTLGLRAGETIPPYMAVHIRRGDFWSAIKDLTSHQYAHAVSDVLLAVKASFGENLSPRVIVTTDEMDPEWLNPLKDVYGWHLVNHTALETNEKLGHWFPTLLDSIMLSESRGFLGVWGSTMSILCMRRVIDWQGGIGRLINANHAVPDGWSYGDVLAKLSSP